MLTRTSIAVLISVSVLSACATQHPSVHMSPTVAGGSPTGTAGGPRAFRALLHAQGTTVTGSVEMRPGQLKGTTFATLNIVGGTAGATYGWAIHLGQCGSEGNVLAEASSYPAVTIESSGAATAQATLRIDPPAGGNYYVAIHALNLLTSPIVSCGELEKVGV
jgi:hypothetical protein